LIFYIRDEFGYEFGVGTYILVTCLVPMFWNQRKPKPSQSGETQSNLVWFGRVPTSMSFVVMPNWIDIKQSAEFARSAQHKTKYYMVMRKCPMDQAKCSLLQMQCGRIFFPFT